MKKTRGQIENKQQLKLNPSRVVDTLNNNYFHFH